MSYLTSVSSWCDQTHNVSKSIFVQGKPIKRSNFPPATLAFMVPQWNGHSQNVVYTVDSTVNFEWSPTFDISSFVILDQCSYLGRSSLPPFEMIYHTSLILYIFYILLEKAELLWFHRCSRSKVISCDFSSFFVLSRSDFLKLWMFSTFPHSLASNQVVLILNYQLLYVLSQTWTC